MANLEQVSQMQEDNKRDWIQRQYASSSPAHIHERLQRLYDRSDIQGANLLYTFKADLYEGSDLLGVNLRPLNRRFRHTG